MNKKLNNSEILLMSKTLAKIKPYVGRDVDNWEFSDTAYGSLN